MKLFKSVRFRLAGTVLAAVLSALLLLWIIEFFLPREVDAHKTTLTPLERLPLHEFFVGVFALGAAWYGGERFILKQVRQLSVAAKRLESGDLAVKTELSDEPGELGELGRNIDAVAAALSNRAKEREQSEKQLLDKNFQQTVVSALGQFALVSPDFNSLLNQSVMLVAQTLGMEYCGVFELLPDGKDMVLRAGVGWKPDSVGRVWVGSEPATQIGYTLYAGEPVVVEDLSRDARFKPSRVLTEHGVISGVTVAITGHGRAYGVLGVHTTRLRLYSEDEVHFMLAVATVLAMGVERARTEEQLQKQSLFTQLNPTPAMELAADASVTYLNDAALKLVSLLGQTTPEKVLPPSAGEMVLKCLETGTTLRVETQLAGRTLSWSFHPVKQSHAVHCYVEDISQRLSLEAQLRQSQKMESIGQLAAGIAHDFNNMLTIIQGHAGILVSRPHLPADLLESAQAIHFGSERAAGLTRQLLMFSRKNVIQPKALDLRELVGNLTKMLTRLVGEPVRLVFDSPQDLPLVQGDAGMIEQVIMNLAVNARDAMPKGGTLSIQLSAAHFDYHHSKPHSQAQKGSFVRLRVVDTGCGMDKATLARIFEPFFTTKEVGKGTGLGLATVYGIVRQHGGWLDVQSAPGRGTTFDVLLPALAGLSPAPKALSEAPKEARGSETILVVEDEPLLREMAVMILKEFGYRTLEAGSGVEALSLWEEQAAHIDLLLTDMVMPEGISGMDLAVQLQASKPRLKVIFASGYSMDDLDPSFIQNGRAAFLQKPYTHLSLTQAVRQCLDGKEVVEA